MKSLSEKEIILLLSDKSKISDHAKKSLSQNSWISNEIFTLLTHGSLRKVKIEEERLELFLLLIIYIFLK